MIGSCGVDIRYSEVFRVCDCEMDAIGDGTELLENGGLASWAEVANPNNYPTDFTLANNDANNYFAEDPVGSANCISNGVSAVNLSQTILTIGDYYVINIDITDVTSGGIRIGDSVEQVTLTTEGSHNIVIKAQSTIFRIIRSGVTDVTFDNISVQKFQRFQFCDMVSLEWWNDCDFELVYQYGYHNRMFLTSAGKSILDTPRPEITKDTNEKDGLIRDNTVQVKKFYQFKTLVPEFVYNALIRIPQYESGLANASAIITLPNGSSGVLGEVNITAEWQDNSCMCHVIMEFLDEEYPSIKGNCCDDLDLSTTL
jgi:hypothetical protein